MIKKKKKNIEKPIVIENSIILGIVVDDEIIEKFGVSSSRLASLFLSNPKFIEIKVNFSI